jgi:hypothetical protein
MAAMQLLFVSAPTFSQPEHALPLNQSPANVLALPEAGFPVPEPNATVVSIAGGVLLLLISRRYVRH